MPHVSNTEFYRCPVCAYGLNEPPENYYICPCCGTEFENDDYKTSHSELRARWIARGTPWFSDATHPPDSWDPIAQLEALAHSARPFEPPVSAATGSDSLVESSLNGDIKIISSAENSRIARKSYITASVAHLAWKQVA